MSKPPLDELITLVSANLLGLTTRVSTSLLDVGLIILVSVTLLGLIALVSTILLDVGLITLVSVTVVTFEEYLTGDDLLNGEVLIVDVKTYDLYGDLLLGDDVGR